MSTNNLDKQYQVLLQDIIDNGVKKEDRTGTGTISVFGRQIRHNMSEGFPLLTTKKMPFKTIVTELLWFLQGNTNIKYLVDNNCHIWDGDAYKNYIFNSEWFPISSVSGGFIGTKANSDEIMTQELFINKIKTDDEFAKRWGELGPIYGAQWRKWAFIDDSSGYREDWEWDSIDQIQNLINDLKTNPDSRRLMVNAWNVGELDQMVLPPCHYGFQVYTRELTGEERWDLLKKKVGQERFKSMVDEIVPFGGGLSEELQSYNIPKRAISLMWNQRSVDTFLGLPFNIASYGLLLMMIADEVNMVPDQLIGNLGDVHLYSNHIDAAKEQIGRPLTFDERYKLYSKSDTTWEEGGGNAYGKITALDLMDDDEIPTQTREPFPLPIVKLSSGHNLRAALKGNFDEIEISDIMLINYQSHPAIKAPLSN
ncbi:thymidylate synthase [Flavobacterium phage vB_FspM_immuto_2-6A]|uniref:thymidylate synthase n=1 Tax=Flavobacterium phage vB_FspM_immuto_2-6A TaxID=2801477 RepID=A0A7T8IWM6_9CAUD|nr:thymidylate synthase [Flavobacterium phage vB_FspM_immuto_2-6A]QQO91726.1 thymidylate synthase [Flavobacterium phage vB_FspM_immuto_2-6A]